MRLWMGVHVRVAEVRDVVVDGCTIAGMVVLMCWEMRMTICLVFVPRKRFMRYKICLVRHLVPVERFSRNKSVNR